MLPTLITGAAGFIGSRLAQDLLQQTPGYLLLVDHLPHFDQRTLTCAYIRRFRERVTLLDREALGRRLDSTQSGPEIEKIVHLGALTDTRETNAARLAYLNIAYSQTLWRWAERAQIPFIYASSAATYGAGEWGYDDAPLMISRLKPLNLYGQSKQDFDVWALAEAAAHRTPPYWCGFKFFNVYGQGETHKEAMGSVILHAFRQIQEKGVVRLFKSERSDIADGDQRRDFVAVEDIVQALRFAMQGKLQSSIYNLGTGKARSYLDLSHAVFAALRREPAIEFIDLPPSLRQNYQYFTQADLRRLRLAGYTAPFRDLEIGVREYVKSLVALS